MSKFLSPNDYRNAILVQDACNLSGVAHSLAEVTDRVWADAREIGAGTDYVNTHPIVVLYVSKLASLSRCEMGQFYHHAYAFCQKMAQREGGTEADVWQGAQDAC